MKKYITILLFLCAFVLNMANAQDSKTPSGSTERTSRNAVSLELLGKGVLYSVNYSRFIADMFAINAGLSYFSLSSTSYWIVPLTASFLYGNDNHFFDLEAGIDSVVTSYRYNYEHGRNKTFLNSSVVPVVGAGYRYWPSNGGFHFRAMVDVLIGDSVAVWPGLSFGYAF